MKNPIPLFILLLLGWIAGLASYTRKTCGDCASPNAVSAVTPTAVPNLTKSLLIADNAHSFTAQTDDNLTFKTSAFAFEQPIADKLKATFQETATYLKGHPERSITINGLYGEKENNTSIFPNLGIARAESVKNLLQSLGCPASQIAVTASMLPALTGDTVVGGANYAFMDTPTTPKEEGSAAKVLDKTIILYFDTNASSLTLSDEQRTFFGDAISYLDKNPKAQIKVTGHTDNKGDAAMNVKLSQERAAFVKKYLSDNNINAAQIATAGEGPKVPVADNGTPAGRAKNRRVEIVLSK